jgi:hypothetical protein
MPFARQPGCPCCRTCDHCQQTTDGTVPLSMKVVFADISSEFPSYSADCDECETLDGTYILPYTGDPILSGRRVCQWQTTFTLCGVLYRMLLELVEEIPLFSTPRKRFQLFIRNATTNANQLIWRKDYADATRVYCLLIEDEALPTKQHVTSLCYIGDSTCRITALE